MSRANSKTLMVLDGYEIVATNKKGEVGVFHPYGGNFFMTLERLEALVTALSNPNFRANFYNKNVNYRLEDTIVQFGRRPDNSVLAVIADLQISKSREAGALFTQSRMGACYSLPIDLIDKLHVLYTQNAEFRARIGLN